MLSLIAGTCRASFNAPKCDPIARKTIAARLLRSGKARLELPDEPIGVGGYASTLQFARQSRQVTRGQRMAVGFRVGTQIRIAIKDGIGDVAMRFCVALSDGARPVGPRPRRVGRPTVSVVEQETNVGCGAVISKICGATPQLPCFGELLARYA